MLPNLTKAKALNHVRERLQHFAVPEFRLISCDDWQANSHSILDSIQKYFCEKLLVIRSSASDEDGQFAALAGEYESVLNVPANDRIALHSAFSKVIASYAKRGIGTDGEEVMVQEMVSDVVLSGVVFTHELNSGAPYYVVNYDDISGLTNTVTSGAGEYSNRTLYIHRGAAGDLRSERFQRLAAAVSELERVVGSDFLDIVCSDSASAPLFQFRAIITRPNWNRAWLVESMQSAGIQTFVREKFRPQQCLWDRQRGADAGLESAEMIKAAARSPCIGG